MSAEGGTTLITGGRGFIGRAVLSKLLAQGEEVHALTRRPPPSAEGVGVTWHRGDLADRGATRDLLASLRPDRLLHLAWYVEHGRFWEAPENLEWVSRSLHLVEAFAKAGGRRAVILGTCAEYDWSSAEQPLRELDSPQAPTTLYGACKDALRRMCDRYAANAGVAFAWGRLFFLYGPGEAPGRLVSSVARSLLAGQPVETTSGVQRRDFMHVADVAGATAALLRSGVTGPVNIASGQAVAVSEVVDRLAEAARRPDLVRRGALPDRPAEPPLLAADVTRLTEEVGYRPSIDLASGLADTLEWWRTQLAAPSDPAELDHGG